MNVACDVAQAKSILVEIGPTNGWIDEHPQVAFVDPVVGRFEISDLRFEIQISDGRRFHA
jgi:hypothetical protein